MSRPVQRVALALLLAAPAVRAQDVVGVLAVAEPPGPAGELATATEQLRAALAAAMPGVLPAGELRARMTPRPPRATLAELRRAHAGAMAAYAAGEFESSVKTLRAVVEALEDLPEDAEVHAEWTASLLRLARSEQELGRRVEAQGILERLLRAAPDTRPDARRYPPSFLALVEDARERLRAGGTRRLTVEAEAGARVFVEGREVGAAPVTLALPPGRYRVGAERGGIRAPRATVELADDDRTVQLDLPLAAALRPDAGPGLAVEAAEQPLRIVSVAARLSLDRAVTTALRRDGEVTLLVATLHDVRRGRAEREGRIRLEGGTPPAGAVEALAAFLATGRASALVTTPAGPSLVLTPAPPAPSPITAPVPGARVRAGRSWATGLGALGACAATVVATGVAIKYAGDASQYYDEARSMLDPAGRVGAGLSVSHYNAMIRKGDDSRRIAIGMAAGAGVGLAATAALSYLYYRDAGDGSFRF